MKPDAATGTDKTLDVTMLDELRELESGGEAGLVAGLIADFKQRAPELVGEIKKQIAAADWPHVERAAHSLKSSSALLGGLFLSEPCAELEALAEAKDATHITPTLVAQIENDLQTLVPLLDAYLKQSA